MSDRFCFVKDDSCHWYCVPINKKNSFYQWVEAMENDMVCEDDFEDYRLDMYVSNYSFENMEESI